MRRVALVKSRDEVFKVGLQTELFDPTQDQLSKYDRYIVSEPGILAEKVPKEEVLSNIMMLYHRYSNMEG